MILLLQASVLARKSLVENNSSVVLALWLLSVQLSAAERINQEGRILGPQPVVTEPILFNTTNADAVLSAMQILPVTHPWNEDVSRRPVLPNSDAMIAQIISDLASNRRTLRAFYEMNFVLAPDNQPLVPIEFVDYPDESDLNGGTFPNGLYPIPANQPIETWPLETGSLTLEQWQQTDDGSDRHSIVVQPGAGLDWETWRALRTGPNWQAANGAIFNLNSNTLRPDGWTSGDAAGLPMFPALVRFDECERGMVEHACRLVVKRTRKQYLYPATHYASTTAASQTNVPAMGQRLRLKSTFTIADNWTQEEKAVLRGLKKYGALVADNGGFFSISVTPDDRWPSGCFDHLSSIGITNFEVVLSTGANESPRSPGAPSAFAGTDFSATPGLPVQLHGVVVPGNAPTTVQWRFYSGAGSVTFANQNATNATVNFSTPGNYTLMLSADDGVHAVAFDAVNVTVTPAIIISIARFGTNLNLRWTAGSPPYIVERAEDFPPRAWSEVLTTSVENAVLPLSSNSVFFRVTEQ